MSFLGVEPATDAEHEAALAALDEAGCSAQRRWVDDAARYGWDGDTLMAIARDLIRLVRTRRGET
jgi:hypothetical protein